MKYRTYFSGEEKELQFVQKKVIIHRGISQEKRKTVSDLVSLLPINRRSFWETLPESDMVADLVTCEDVDDLF